MAAAMMVSRFVTMGRLEASIMDMVSPMSS